MLEKFITLMLVGRKDEEKGATATEYGLLVGLIALIIVVGVAIFGDALNQFFDDLGTTVGGW
jgi:pilus assembly protein Flp/PilA